MRLFSVMRSGVPAFSTFCSGDLNTIGATERFSELSSILVRAPVMKMPLSLFASG